jgi:peptidoglycan hydrolase CwlO-like protein
MTKKTLIEQIQITTDNLTELETEQADLSKRMSDAADDADSSALITLAHRRNNLPIEILSTRIILERLYVQRGELRLPELQNVVAELAKPIPEMQKQIADLQQEFNVASGNVSNANEDVRQTRMEISERKRTIESLLAQARNVKIAPTSLQMNGGR